MSAINQLLESTPLLWKGRQSSRGQAALSSGHASLDTRLPGNGWPLGAISELISHSPGLGEFRLLFPALSRLGQQGLWVILVDPPWIPYPAALQGHGLLLERLLLIRTRGGKESAWACEQALRNGRGGAVLAWPEQIDFARLRRLQMAAESSAKLAFLFRPESAGKESSPAALRLQLKPGNDHSTIIHIIKCRGNRPPDPVHMPQPFSTYAKQHHQTREPLIHDAPTEETSTTRALAGHPISTAIHGPPVPGTKLH